MRMAACGGLWAVGQKGDGAWAAVTGACDVWLRRTGRGGNYRGRKGWEVQVVAGGDATGDGNGRVERSAAVEAAVRGLFGRSGGVIMWK